MHRIPFLLLALLITAFTSAQTTRSVDTIQVVATQVPLPIPATGRSITVLTSEQITSLPATSLDEILQTVPGLEVQSRGGFGVQGDILLRGSTFTQVLVLVDGMKVNDPLTGHFNSYLPVTPAEIERIEVLRGAAAALYGADAVGGVINIVTKTFSPSANENQYAGTINYGEHKLINGYQGFQVQQDRVSFSGGFQVNQSEGEYIAAQSLPEGMMREAFHTDFDIKTIGAALGYRLTERTTLRLRTAYDYRDFGARYFYTTSLFDKARETVNSWWNHAQLRHTGAKSVTDFNVAYRYGTDRFVFSPDFPSTNEHTTRYINTTLNHLRPLNETTTLKTGLQVDRRQIESNDRGNHADWHAGAYAMAVYRQDRLNLTASLRGDYDENYAFELSPQLNVSYVWPRLVVRGSVGRSIRAADYTERYVSNNLPDLTPGRSLGNPDLVAETAWSEELGVDYTVTPGWQLSATAFARQSANLIDYVSTNETLIGSVSETGSLQPGGDYFFARNITDVATRGVELISDVVTTLGSKGRLHWNLGYTYLRTSNAEEVVSVYISSHARHLFTTQLTAHVGRFELSVSGLRKERDASAAPAIGFSNREQYTVWHLRGGIGLTEQVGLNVQLQNVFAAEYANILGAPMPGRWFLGGIRWQF